MIKNKPAIAHFASNNVGGKLLLISRDAWRVISLNNTGYFTSSIVCPDSANSRQHFDDAIDVVKGALIIMHMVKMVTKSLNLN